MPETDIRIFIIGAIVLIFLFVNMQKQPEGLNFNFYKGGKEIRDSFPFATAIISGVFDEFSLSITVENTGDCDLQNLIIEDAYPTEFENALPSTTKTLDVGERQSLWVSDLMDASQFLGKSQPVEFWVNVSGDCGGEKTYEQYSINLDFEEKLDPTEISTCQQLQNLKNEENFAGEIKGFYVLKNNIDCSDTQTWDNGKGFNPLYRFSGVLDGNGYEIINLYINRPNREQGISLIHQLFGTVQNLGMINVDITGGKDSYLIGSIAGYSSGMVKNSYSSGNIEGGFNVGGLVGELLEYSGDTGSIINSYSKSNVHSEKVCGGGGLSGGGLSGQLVGDAYIRNSYSVGKISCSGSGPLLKEGGYCSNSFWDTGTSGQSSTSCGTGKTTSEMKDVATFTDLSTSGLNQPWDFVNNPNDDVTDNDYWDIIETINNGYPYLHK